MSFNTSADIQNGFFGRWECNSKGQKKFIRLGKVVTLETIYEDIENDLVYLKLSCDYLGRTKYMYVEHGQLTDVGLAKDLSNIGADVTRKNFDVMVDTIRIQEGWMEKKGIQPVPAYGHLGWIKVPDNNPKGYLLCYRAENLIGAQGPSRYTGDYAIAPAGDYEVWRQMVEDDVVGYPALQLVLIAALSSVIIGLLAQEISVENPIVHLNFPSGKGKSTAGFLAASTAGRPFDGSLTTMDEDGRIVELHSLYQSWGATDNAMVATQAGNRGVVTVLNELGKSLTKNMTRLIFDLSEGSDKKRLTATLNTRVSKGYSTAFISTGESSLLEKCNSRLEGLSVRVMEISKPITKDAEHSNRIKEVCTAHCGHAAPMLAEYILNQGEVDYVLPLYKAWVKKLRAEMPASPSMERFVEKFAALFMVTAEIAEKALNIPFNKDSLLDFLYEYDEENGAKRNTSATSYDVILEQCRINSHKFHIRNDKSITGDKPTHEPAAVPSQECWGRVTNMQVPYTDNRVIVQEFEIRKSVAEKILRDNGFDNKTTCIEAWKAADVLDYEDKHHPTRRRKIDVLAAKGSAEDVYVFRVFADKESVEEIMEEIRKRMEDEAKRQKKILKNKAKILELLHEKEDEDDGCEPA